MHDLEKIWTAVPQQPEPYDALLRKRGWEQLRYLDFMITHPIRLDLELQRVEQADFSLCCALLTALLREDHFSNGAFEKRLQGGDVKRILDRMYVLAGKGEPTVSGQPENRATVGELFETRCRLVSDQNGVYIVESPSQELSFLPEAPQAAGTPYSAAELQRKWAAGDRRCLYIGKAARQGGLRKRLWEYVGSGYGLKKNHRGGRAIWQVEDFEKLTIRWEAVPDANQMEHELLRYYKTNYGTYPAANWRG